VLAALFVVGALAADAPAHADGAVPARETPLGGWCVAPRCARADAGPELIRRPLALPSTRQTGMLEQMLRRSILRSIEDALRDARVGHRALRDVLSALAAALAKDEVALERTSGLGAAALRAGLTIETTRAISQDARCAGAARVDAVYEGLALGPLGALGFTEATGQVSPACLETARSAERFVSRALLVSVASGAGPVLLAAEARVRDVRTRCAAAELSDETATVDELARVLGTLSVAREALVRDTAGEGCGEAVDAAVALDVSSLAKLSRAGLGEVPARAIASELTAAAAACDDSPETCDAKRRLVAVLAVLAANGAPTEETLISIVRALAAAVVPPGSDPGVALAAIRALEVGVVSAAGHATIDPDLVVAEVERRYALRDGKPTLRSLLGVDASPWIVELNGAVPKLDTGDLRVVGDATLGYETARVGVVVRGGVRYFDFVSPLLATDNLDAQGWLESWIVTGNERSVVRLEGRIAGGAEYVDTTTIARPDGPGRTRFGDYDSLLVRGALLVGLRVRPHDRLALRVLGGGGYQFERFDSTSIDALGISLDAPNTSSAHGSGRLDARFIVARSVISLRGQAELKGFTMTREELAFAANYTGGSSLGLSMTTQIQVFAGGRVFVDADLLSFGGFVPAVFAGADYTYLQSPAGERSTTVPFAGIGIVRHRM
jgi:hypothetical protein